MPVKSHNNPEYEIRRATAPYNFIPLPDVVLPAPDFPDHDTFDGKSGYFDCTLTTVTPTYIRGMMSADQFERLAGKKRLSPEEKRELADFFKIGGQAAIPGSSLRGMFRTLIEVLTYSKPLAVSKYPLVYRSVDKSSNALRYRARMMEEKQHNEFVPRYKAGWMRRKGVEWYIQPALEPEKIGAGWARVSNDLLNNMEEQPKLLRENWPNVSKVFVQVNPATYQLVHGFTHIKYAKVAQIEAAKAPGLQEAYLCKSGKIGGKLSEALIFPPDLKRKDPSDWLLVPDEVCYQYRENVSPAVKDITGENSGVLQEGYPVFYLAEDGQVAALSHCPMIRIPYKHTPYELVPPEIRNGPLDLAEAMFGYTGKEDGPKGKSRAGRLRFTDALAENGQQALFLPVIRPQVLSSPKPTSFQLYLAQESPDYADELLDYESDTNIRGTKFYWHKGKRSTDQLTSVDPQHETQHTRIQPVREGVRFTFRVEFENLTEIELGALAYTLSLGSHPKLCLKLGMGKPLGMGAVKIEYRLTLIDRKSRYQRLFARRHQTSAPEGPERFEELGVMQAPHDKLKASRNAFKTWLLGHEAINPGLKFQLIEQLPRIGMLLEMLRWQEEAETDRLAHQTPIGVFRERKVLPDPCNIYTDLLPGNPPQKTREEEQRTADEPLASERTLAVDDLPVEEHSTGGTITEKTPKAQDPQQTHAPQVSGEKANSKIEKTTRSSVEPASLQPGDEVFAEVMYDPDPVFKDCASLSIRGWPDCWGLVNPNYRTRDRYKVGDVLRCRVMSVGEQQDEDLFYDLQPFE